jgi:hypothetical protein
MVVGMEAENKTPHDAMRENAVRNATMILFGYEQKNPLFI